MSPTYGIGSAWQAAGMWEYSKASLPTLPHLHHTMPGSSYTTPRRIAWALAEKRAPNDPVKQQEIFDKEFERLCRNQDNSQARNKAGLVPDCKIPKGYDGFYTSRPCSGFFHYNFLNGQ